MADQSLLLAIDTSTTTTGLALWGAEGLRAECVWAGGRNHTAQVLPQLDMLLRHLQGPSDLGAVAVALGPGSWSGLRVGMSIAKGLVLAHQLVLLGIGTLDAIAAQHAAVSVPIYPLIGLGRDRVASARFLPRADGLPQRQDDDRNLTLAELCAELDEEVFFCGEIDSPLRAQLEQSLGSRARFPAPTAALRRPACLAELAWQRYMRAEKDDPLLLEPRYLGEPVKPKA